MRRSPTLHAASLALVAVVAACADRGPTSGPQSDPHTSLAPASCTATLANLQLGAVTLLGASSPYLGVVRDSLTAIDARLGAGSIAAAQASAQALITYLQSRAGTIPATTHQIDDYTNNILCWVGLAQQHTFLVPPSTETQVLKAEDGSAGVQLPPNAVSTPTVVTITVVDGDLLTENDTKLDRYPRSINVSSSTAIAGSTVGVCVKDVPASVFRHLRMGHRTSTGFRIEPPASTAFLGCPGDPSGLASGGRVRRWLDALASVVLPRPLYAKMQGDALISGGVGGTAGEYSPFEPVDTELSISGGVGGTAGEYIRVPAPGAPSAGGPRANTVLGGVCTAVEAIVGTALEPECRPRMEIRTANGTVLQGVPVAWQVVTGSGAAAAENPVTRSCGAFGAAAGNSTNENGKAGACWTMGAQVGVNTLVATPGSGGDAPVGVTFSPANQTFTANALSNTPTATAVGEAVAFDGLEHPGSGTCSNGLAPSFSYSGDGSVPRNIGHYTLTVSCGGGNTSFVVVTATADITIGIAVPVITITCPASVVFTGAAQTPCSAAIHAPGLSLVPALLYAGNVNAGTASASAVYSGGGNYAAATASRTFQVSRAPTTTVVSCPASRVYTGSPIAPCTVTVTGVGGLDLTPTPSYSSNLNVGTATASYSFVQGGNYLGSTDAQTFQVLAAPSATTVTCPASVSYNGAVQAPCAATVTGAGGLNAPVPVSYVPAAPRNAGSYTAAAAFAGDANHVPSSGSGSVAIAPVGATATAGSGTMEVGGPVPVLPCTVTVLPVDASGITCVTNVPNPLVIGANVTSPGVTPGNPPNYVLALVNGTLTVTSSLYQQDGCFAAPLTSTLPPTSASLARGTPVAVRCRLRDAQGAIVTNAVGDLRVEDIGANGTATGAVVLFKVNAFDVVVGDNVYWLDTSVLTAGRYYRVTATWNDGSGTTGYFYISP